MFDDNDLRDEIEETLSKLGGRETSKIPSNRGPARSGMPGKRLGFNPQGGVSNPDVQARRARWSGDSDLSDEIEGMFADHQEAHASEVTGSAVYCRGDDGQKLGGKRWNSNAGFRIFHPNPPKSPERKKRMREYEAKYAADDIRARILAGERPKLGGRGRPPTRWFKIAEELGIDLRAPITPLPAA